MMFSRFEIEGPILFLPRRLADERGWLCETFRQESFDEETGGREFVQHNQSMSVDVGTIRGLHFQTRPMAQGKLVRCVHGALLDVAVDIRRSSPTFGRYVAVELSAENGRQLWIPEGFAHGFVTRMPRTEIFYLMTNYYSPEHSYGLQWDDPDLGIDWGVDGTSVSLSEKDRTWPGLASLTETFA